MTTRLAKTLEIRTSPHIVSGYSVDTIMFNVVVALVPAIAFAVYAFGLAAVAVIATAIGSCVGFEHLFCRATGKRTTVGDWSAAVTGLLYGLTLPASLPLWMVVVGGAVSIFIGKTLFGGLGFNPFNPALVGRAVLQATFPVPMTTWMVPFTDGRFGRLPGSLLTAPFLQPVYDVTTGATPLALWKFSRQLTGTRDLALGFVGGSAGETSAVLLLLGGAYLVARNMMSWRTPLAIFASVAVISGAMHFADPARYSSPAFMLFSGGLVLGAVFMATDMVTSPIGAAACWVYGALIGALGVVIRTWGGMPEGGMYAILLGNAVAPHLDRLMAPRVYGTRRGKAAT
jgi:electron transport complex protein RnfD